MSLKVKLISFIITCLLYACQPEEIPVPKHLSGNILTGTVNMESNYKWQIFYDLSANKVVSKNLKTAWDLGFYNGAEDYNIVLNSSKVMSVAKFENQVFENVLDTIGFNVRKKWDHSSGNIDSLAIGDWRKKDAIFIIDRGYNEIGIHQGFRKLQVIDVTESTYTFKFGILNDLEGDTVKINKNNDYNLSYFSFNSNQQVNIEPKNNSWDVVFTQYTHTFYNPLQPYLVTGCIINKSKIKATVDSLETFSTIDYVKAKVYNLCENEDVIGYN